MMKSALSVAKHITPDDRQRMSPEAQQHSFICAENVDRAEPILRILCTRWVRARKFGSNSFLETREQYGDDVALPDDAGDEEEEHVVDVEEESSDDDVGNEGA
jgi:hypothetical protein